MKQSVWLVVVLLCLCAGCRTTAPLEPVTAVEGMDYDVSPEILKLHKKLKPLERPQVRYTVERAVKTADSCWVLVRVAIPYKAIWKKEFYSVDMIFHVPEGMMELGNLSLDSRTHKKKEGSDSGENPSVDVETRANHIEYIYYSTKFAYDERMEENAEILLIPRLSNERYIFGYEATVLPLYWIDDEEEGLFWSECADLPQEVLLDSSPIKR